MFITGREDLPFNRYGAAVEIALHFEGQKKGLSVMKARLGLHQPKRVGGFQHRSKLIGNLGVSHVGSFGAIPGFKGACVYRKRLGRLSRGGKSENREKECCTKDGSPLAEFVVGPVWLTFQGFSLLVESLRRNLPPQAHATDRAARRLKAIFRRWLFCGDRLWILAG